MSISDYLKINSRSVFFYYKFLKSKEIYTDNRDRFYYNYVSHT